MLDDQLQVAAKLDWPNPAGMIEPMAFVYLFDSINNQTMLFKTACCRLQRSPLSSKTVKLSDNRISETAYPVIRNTVDSSSAEFKVSVEAYLYRQMKIGQRSKVRSAARVPSIRPGACSAR